ncbi:MAG: S-layer homology domain-containing protein [Clostridiales bacterium]|nr:S-layer homology domain-containing protein [Clostridiales bacterium]
MKSLNRTLSLILVLTMVFGLFGVASAATFSDNASVQYSEAVGVMTGIGAINGYADGTFKPAGSITREEAAKMVAYAVLGPTTASKLSVSATGFKDVAANRWSAPYIAYCVSKGIINGMGAGTFAPTANVTGYQLAKMMLCAAGYGKANEFVGPGWELNVAVTANKYKVFSGSKAIDFAKAATREEAALYVFNALTKVPQVTYSKLTESYTTTAAGAHDINGDSYAQIAEDVYTTLTMESATVGGRTGHVWKLGTENISSFVASDTVLATSTDGTSYANLTTASSSDYIKYQPDSAVTYYYNDGAASTSWPTADTVPNNEAIIKGYCTTPGAVVQFIDSDSDNLYDKVSVTVKTVEQLATAPTVTTAGSVTTVTVGSISKVSDLISYPSGLAKNDVILYYTSASGKVYVEKAASITGKISSFVNGLYVTICGKNYADSGLSGAPAAYDTIGELQGLIGKDGYTFYLDNGGNICYVVAPSANATVSNTFFVAATDTSTSFGTTTYKASVVKSDGSQEVITVKKTASNGGTLTNVSSTTAGSSADGNLGAGIFYTYALNSDGTYNLTAAANQSINATDLTQGLDSGALDADDTSFVVTGNRAQFLGAVTATGNTWNGLTPVYTSSKVATSGTIFMYYNSTTKTYTVKTGITNAMSYAAGGTIYVLADSTNTYAQIVICTGSSATSSASGYDQSFITSVATTSLDSNGTPLYTYSAIVNGATGKTVSSYDALTKGTLYFVKDYASNGAVSSGAALTGITGTQHTSMVDVTYTSGVMTIDAGSDGAYVLSGNCAIFLCDASGSTTTVSQITADQADALTYDTTNDTVYMVPASSTDSSIATIYIFID